MIKLKIKILQKYYKNIKFVLQQNKSLDNTLKKLDTICKLIQMRSIRIQEVIYMSGAIMNKVWDLFGMDTAEDKEENEYEYEDYEQEEDIVEEKRTWGKRSKLLSLPQAQQRHRHR